MPYEYETHPGVEACITQMLTAETKVFEALTGALFAARIYKDAYKRGIETAEQHGISTDVVSDARHLKEHPIDIHTCLDGLDVWVRS